MNKLLDVHDKSVVEAFVRSVEPDAEQITVLDHSYHNVIVIVDEVRVFRFPRTPEAALRQRYETEILRRLRGKTSLPIPEVLAVHSEPTYSILSFLWGQHIMLTQLSDVEAKQVAVQFATFIFELAQAIPVSKVRTVRTACGLDDHKNDESWADYIDRVLARASFPGQPWLENIAYEYATKWQDMQAQSDLPLQTVHDDLHSENILFQGDRVAGVLDFGLTNIGTAAQEMRQLYHTDSDILQKTIEAYARLSGQHVRLQDVQTWAITAELASYCHHLALGETTHPSYARTRNNLRSWLPEFLEHDTTLPIEAIIFDCFGVLASEGLRPFRQKYFGHDMSLLHRAVSLGRQVDAGKKSYDTLITEMASMAGLTPEEVRKHVECNEPDLALFACIKDELKPHYKIGMLSNAGDNWLDEIFTPEQVALFDEVALSYQTGFVKPDKQAYIDIARRLGVSPSQCLFVDDQPRYLTGARAVGMHTILYKDFAGFRTELDGIFTDKDNADTL